MTSMKQIVALATSHGYDVVMERPECKLTRFRLDEGFVDVWCSPKKGITVGVYDLRTKKCSYYRSVKWSDLDEVFGTGSGSHMVSVREERIKDMKALLGNGDA